jgi:hypothetical protein
VQRLKWMCGRAVVLAGLVCLTGAGAADASCPTLPTSLPFAGFGDSAPYELAPQGGFETGVDGWDLDRADLIVGNESYFAGSDADSGSLRLSAKGVAVSPPLCVDVRRPTWRLFARKLTRNKGQLKFEMLFTDSDGNTKVAQAGRVSNGRGEYSDWSPTPQLVLGRGLPLSSSPTGTMSIRLRFSADKAGDWAVDDIYLDPYRS